MLVELRVKLAQAIRRCREQSDLSQKHVAARIKSSQPRVAKIEAAAPDVSLDQMFRGLFAVGGKVEDLSAPAPSGRAARRKGKKSGAPAGV